MLKSFVTVRDDDKRYIHIPLLAIFQEGSDAIDLDIILVCADANNIHRAIPFYAMPSSFPADCEIHRRQAKHKDELTHNLTLTGRDPQTAQVILHHLGRSTVKPKTTVSELECVPEGSVFALLEGALNRDRTKGPIHHPDTFHRSAIALN